MGIKKEKTLLEKIEKAKEIINNNTTGVNLSKISIAFSGGKDSAVLLDIVIKTF